MKTQPYLGATRRVNPGASPQGGFQFPEGLIDWQGSERNRALGDLLRKIDQESTAKKNADREALKSAQREMRKANKDLQENVRRAAKRQAMANARAMVKAARMARGLARRHPAGMLLDIAAAMSGRVATPTLPNLMPQFGLNALNCGYPGLNFDGCQYVDAFFATCIAGQGVGGPACPASNVAAGTNQIGYYKRYIIVPGLWRGALVGNARRAAPGAASPSGTPHPAQPAFPAAGPRSGPDPGRVGAESSGDTTDDQAPELTDAGAVGERWPAMAPEAMPMNRPTPLPRPIPRSLLKLRSAMPAYRKGGLEMSSFGYSAPGRDPDVEVAPQQGPTISVTPNAPPQMGPPRHERRPPGKREKEMKTGGFRLILAAVNAVTESKDFIDGLYEGVDDQCKKKWEKKLKKASGYSFMRPQDKARVLYECAGPSFDMCKATKALVENQVEDFVFGKTGQRLGKLANQWGPRKVRIGFQAGGSLGKTNKDATPKGPENKKPWDKWTDHIIQCG